MSDSKAIINIPIDRIAPSPYQPRKEFNGSSLEDLASSIKEYGVLQPINVRKIGEKGFELVSGERRLRASRLAGKSHIPAVIIEVVEQDSAVIALIENLQREDLNFLEEAEGYHNLINDHGMTQEELAKKVGKKQSTIANKLRLLKLNKSIKGKILENELTERHARALLKLTDEVLQEKALQSIIKKSLNVKKSEDLVEKMLEEAAVTSEEPEKKRIKGKINYKIYVNTIKNACKEMFKTGCRVEYGQVDKGEFIEITVRIPKNM